MTQTKASSGDSWCFKMAFLRSLYLVPAFGFLMHDLTVMATFSGNSRRTSVNIFFWSANLAMSRPPASMWGSAIMNHSSGLLEYHLGSFILFSSTVIVAGFSLSPVVPLLTFSDVLPGNVQFGFRSCAAAAACLFLLFLGMY